MTSHIFTRPRIFNNAAFSSKQFKSDIRRPASHTQYVTFFTPRSGSTWLAEVLLSHEIGNPREWLNPQVVRSTVTRINAQDPNSYWEMLQRMEAPNGIFGLKVTYFHLVRTLINPSYFFRHYSMNAPVFFLIREDIVSQAISLAKAFHSGIFHSPQATYNQISKLDTTFKYEPEAIRAWIKHLLAMENRTESFLRSFGIVPKRLTYEIVTQTDPQTVSRYYASVLPTIQIKNRGATGGLQRKIATSKNIEFLDRFVLENHNFVEDIAKARSSRIDEAKRHQEYVFGRF